MIKVKKISIKIKNLPSSFDGVKIAHLTDFHSRRFGKKEKRVLEILDEIKPDFVVITGDFVDWSTKDLNSCQDFWKSISKKFEGKTFGVYGNHEHRHSKFKILDNLLKKSGIEFLNNKSTKLKIDNDFVHPVREYQDREKEQGKQFSNGIYLIGVDDPHLEQDNISKATENVKNDAPKILLAHSPEIFRKVKQGNIDLVLVGHTHGGQINIPFLINFLLPLKYDKKYKRGLFFENGTYMYVNRGIGETILPVRFNSFPEVTLITLKSKPEK